MQNNLSINGVPVQSVYSDYKEGKYIVNRRYQRKLIWTLTQKQNFIDSLLNQYPVPLFLGVSVEDSIKGTCFEILDGMQRLEAITSFIEGNFSIREKFFDLAVVAETNRLLNEGKLTQKKPKLEFEECKKILNYRLPVSTYAYTSNKNIDETFRRINTGGVRLSRQEVRQAGSISEFSQLVRKCAEYIRKDDAHKDIVELDKMRLISLTNKDLDYGIKIEDTFWAKNRILTTGNILESRDEELISHILLYIILRNYAQTTSVFLDRVYSENTKDYIKCISALEKVGFEKIYKQFCFVYDELCNTINQFDGSFANHIYNNNKFTQVQNAYQVIFLAFFKLLLDKNRKIQHYHNLAKLMKGVATQCMGKLESNSKWKLEDRIQMINAVCGVIENQFIPREGADPTLVSWVENLENILNQSSTENICYDFKIGLHSLEGDTSFNKKLVSKIVKTLTAMANSHAGENYIILGVADKEDDAKKHEEKYGIAARQYSSFYITGIGSEAEEYHKDIDAYQQKLQQTLDKEPIDEETKRLIQRNVFFSKYHDKDFVVMKIIRGEQPIAYNGEIFVRKIANTDPSPIDKKDIYKFYIEFSEQSKRYPYN
ncbi:Protein of unknown function DUF262 [Cylindrospermum stagnale PCC 7417]|uniref:GmrSD restriction endonucleases N-terminal domain-containing protein n=1 Tax=Cylindrospermum stagnale PCC 7417 TaxID=56107 RepID=K9WWX9_9NOST|nr:DUF262 domain-containing protein [Cylindrospermum stagnale]AFZ24880.1 Protein of unknown function DUF262 [Cylindrospermum stagnale PCC 7417]